MTSRTASLSLSREEEEPLALGLRIRLRRVEQRADARLRQANLEERVLDLALQEGDGVEVPSPDQLGLGSRVRVAQEVAGRREGADDGLRVRTGLLPELGDRVVQALRLEVHDRHIH